MVPILPVPAAQVVAVQVGGAVEVVLVLVAVGEGVGVGGVVVVGVVVVVVVGVGVGVGVGVVVVVVVEVVVVVVGVAVAVAVAVPECMSHRSSGVTMRYSFKRNITWGLIRSISGPIFQNNMRTFRTDHHTQVLRSLWSLFSLLAAVTGGWDETTFRSVYMIPESHRTTTNETSGNTSQDWFQSMVSMVNWC